MNQPCSECGKPIDSAWPGEKGEVCQMCWEQICSEAWWAAWEQTDDVQFLGYC